MFYNIDGYATVYQLIEKGLAVIDTNQKDFEASEDNYKQKLS